MLEVGTNEESKTMLAISFFSLKNTADIYEMKRILKKAFFDFFISNICDSLKQKFRTSSRALVVL